jgi:hypothetical protein
MGLHHGYCDESDVREKLQKKKEYSSPEIAALIATQPKDQFYRKWLKEKAPALKAECTLRGLTEIAKLTVAAMQAVLADQDRKNHANGGNGVQVPPPAPQQQQVLHAVSAPNATGGDDGAMDVDDHEADLRATARAVGSNGMVPSGRNEQVAGAPRAKKYSGWTAKKLQDECAKRNIDYTGLKNDEMKRRLMENDQMTV